MKHYLNEKGSLPIVLVIVFVMTMSVVALTSLSLTEKINLSYSATKDLEVLYKQDAVVESTIHALGQVLSTKRISDISSQNFLENLDITQVENIVNGEFIPNFGLEGYKIYVEEAYNPPTIDYFCSEQVGDDDTFAGFDCLYESFDIHVKLQIEKENTLEEFVIEITNLYPLVSDSGQDILIDTSKANFTLTK